MTRTLRKVLPLLAVISILVMPATLNVEAAAITIQKIGTTPSTNRFYMFQNVHSGKFLEIADGNLTSGTNVWQDTFNYDTNRAQVFRLLVALDADMANGDYGDDYYQLKPSLDATLRLDVDNANDADGTNIKIFGYNPGYGAQSFRFINNGDGSCRIEPYLSRSSGRVLTVVDASASNKANVELSAYTGDTSQKWVVKEFYLAQDPKLINLNWSYFFRGNASTNYRRISRRIISAGDELSHAGIDIPADQGTSIYSPCVGKVVERGEADDGIADSMGNYVIIQTTATIEVNDEQKNLTIRLMHMDEPPEVVNNQTVTTSTLLGYVGNTGDSNGNHLHVDINIQGYHSGSLIRTNPQYVINPEKLYLSKRFRYGLIASTATLATGYIFYPDWEEAI